MCIQSAQPISQRYKEAVVFLTDLLRFVELVSFRRCGAQVGDQCGRESSVSICIAQRLSRKNQFKKWSHTDGRTADIFMVQ